MFFQCFVQIKQGQLNLKLLNLIRQHIQIKHNFIQFKKMRHQLNIKSFIIDDKQLIKQQLQQNMTQQLYRFQYPNRKLSQLLKQLTQNQIQQTSKQLNNLLQEKKAKVRQKYSLSSHQVIQPSLLPTKHSYSQFSLSSPINAQQKFIQQKIKANVLTPQRFYTSQPNVKVGSFAQAKTMNIERDVQIINQKFQDYSHLINQQSGQRKRKRIIQLAIIPPQQHKELPKYKYKRMKQTLFQKFMPDKFNFYAPSMSSHKKSSRFDTSTLKRSQIKGILMEQIKTIDQIRKQSAATSSQQLHTVKLCERTSPYQRSRKINSQKNLEIKSRSKIKDINSIE